jgi:hypothetical protein
MTMIKRGTCSGSVKVAKSLYRCSKCEHQDVSEDEGTEPLQCPVCGADMYLASYSASEAAEK